MAYINARGEIVGNPLINSGIRRIRGQGGYVVDKRKSTGRKVGEVVLGMLGVLGAVALAQAAVGGREKPAPVMFEDLQGDSVYTKRLRDGPWNGNQSERVNAGMYGDDLP